jgi:hypothetical protein
LGSAFFFVHAGHVLTATANHCIPPSHDALQLIGRNGRYDVAVALHDEGYDLCILSPATFPNNISMTLSVVRDTPGNITLIAYEFSTTEQKNGAWRLTPATRIGNCIRLVQMDDVFGPAGVDMLELSFPALRGASGSPVVELRGAQMVARGIVVANTEHHLLPAHIETVLDANNSLLEERRYYLPQAAAVHSMHLARIVDGWLMQGVSGVTKNGA